MRKYPRTPHLAGSRLQPGDDDVGQVPFTEIRGRHVVVEEKLDGANAGISFTSNGEARLQSRGHYLTGGPRERQFALLKSWTAAVAPALWPVLRDRFVLYGEWLYAKHTVYYDALPHYFCEFDVLDQATGEFLSTARRAELLAATPVASVPVLRAGRFDHLDELTSLAGASTVRTPRWRDALTAAAGESGVDPKLATAQTDASDEVEGLYLKVEERGRVVARLKWIRATFMQTILSSGSHWADRPIIPNDVAKPDCTQHHDDGRITSYGHSRRGDLIARRVLWQLRASVAWREHVAALVRHHQLPFWALERPNLESIVLRVSLVARNADLALLASADILGRQCADTAEVLENIDLFREYCADLAVLDRPWQFASDHARFAYFRTPGRDPHYSAYDDTRATMTMMSGLPGTGKDTWIAAHAADQPVVSLDALREQLRVAPSADQGPVIAAAYEQARDHLRAARSFIWNATNISRQQRDRCANLAARYRARVDIVAVEAAPEVVYARNRARTEPVPAQVIDRLVRRWETPDLTEGHTVRWIDTAPQRSKAASTESPARRCGPIPGRARVAFEHVEGA